MLKHLMILATILAAVGAINWGAVAYGRNLVEEVITNKDLVKYVYIAVGVSGIIVLLGLVRKMTMQKKKEQYDNQAIRDALMAARQ